MTLEPMTCADARRAFAAGDASAALHVESCPVCRERLDQLSRAVISPNPDDEISCAEYRRRSEGSTTAEFGEGDWGERLRRHQEQCPECAALAAAMSAALASLADPSAPQPETIPTIDTSFLDASGTPTTLGGEAEGSEKQTAGRVRPAWLAIALLATLALLRFGWLYGQDPNPGEPRGSAVSATSTLAQAVTAQPQDAKALAEALSTERQREAKNATAKARQSPPATLEASRAGARASATAAAEVVASPSPELGGPDTPASPTANTATASPIPISSATATALDPAPPNEPVEPDETPVPESSPTPPMDTLCMLEGQPLLLLEAGCGPFDSMTLFDLHDLDVARPSRWTFSLCGRTRMDTILVLYSLEAFRPDRLCQGIIALDDDYCGRQSRLTVDLQPGRYRLMVADKTADAAERYALRVGAGLPHGGLECPSAVDLENLIPSPTETGLPSPPPPSATPPSPTPVTTPLPTPTPSATPGLISGPSETPTLSRPPTVSPGPTGGPSNTPPPSTPTAGADAAG